MSKFYISYSNKDKDFASALEAALVARGHKVMIDFRILTPGSNWRSSLAKALRDTEIFIALLTQNALDSQFVMSEIGAARTHAEVSDILVIPVIADSIPIPLVVADLQAIFSPVRDIAQILADLEPTLSTLAARKTIKRPITDGRRDMSNTVKIAVISAVASIIVGFLTALASVGPLLAVAIDKEKPQLIREVTAATVSGVPIGTVVASMLDPARFSQMVGTGGDFSPQTSTWIPADGREVPGSRYASVLSRSRVPDLRGLFIRGLNAFEMGRDRLGTEPQWADPDGASRQPGDPQADSFKAHMHKIYTTSGSGVKSGENPNYVNKLGADGSTSAEGGSETRPRNAALYYYIKIN